MPKMISIPNFFFEILQRYCKLVTLSNLKTLDHAINNDNINLVKNVNAQIVEVNF